MASQAISSCWTFRSHSLAEPMLRSFVYSRDKAANVSRSPLHRRNTSLLSTQSSARHERQPLPETPVRPARDGSLSRGSWCGIALLAQAPRHSLTAAAREGHANTSEPLLKEEIQPKESV